MSAVPQQPMTLDAFLAWEERQPVKYEFDGRYPVAMSGGTTTHARIQRNLAIAVGGRLIDGPCEFFGSDIKIEVAGRIRYPDGFVICSKPGGSLTVHRDPTVIFEILSEGTASRDIITKNREYTATPSVRRYVILPQDEIAAIVFERVGGDWLSHTLDTDSVLRLPEIGIELPLAELYRGVELPSRLPD
jgi:Uma2 family endonuclease